jgi:virginiamycin B lyase
MLKMVSLRMKTRALLSIALLGILSRAASAQFALYPVSDPALEPQGVCAGPDGNIWFTAGDRVGRLAADGSITTFALTLNSGAGDIAAGPDGNLWFLERSALRVGRVSPAGLMAEFAIPAANSSPETIVAGPDGAMWFTDFIRGSVWRVSLSGEFVEFPLGSARPVGLVRGSDGNLWFADFEAPGRIGRLRPTGEVAYFPIPAGSSGWRCGLGPDGNVWFTVVGRAFGRVDEAGEIREFPLDGEHGHVPASVALGPDRGLWMPVDETFFCIMPCDFPAERDAVVRVASDGSQMRFELSADLEISDGSRIAAGPGGSMWFTARRGLVRFFPSELDARRPPPRVVGPRDYLIPTDQRVGDGDGAGPGSR